MLKADHDHEREAPDALNEDDPLDAADVGTSVDERSRPTRLWFVAAGVCLFAAAALWLLDKADAAFVVAALGVVAWFLNVRVQLRHKNSHGGTEAQREDEEVD